MGIGKYSPVCNLNSDWGNDYIFNSYGEVPVEWTGTSPYDVKTMFADFDREGFDYYGYSAFDRYGNFVGSCKGIDRAGYTEDDYLMDSINGGELFNDTSINDILKEFPRKR